MPVFCNMCGLRCRSNIVLKSHVKNHYVGVTKCEVCKRTFAHQHLLEIHRRYRHNRRKTELKCTECHTVFKYWRSLKRHVRSMHLNIRNHICHVCGKSFSRKEYVTSHLLRHSRAAAEYLATKVENPSTSDHKPSFFSSLGYERKQLKMEGKKIKRVKSVGKKIKKEKTERKKIKRLKPLGEKIKREKTEGKKIKREQTERKNLKREMTEVKSEEKQQIKKEVFSLETVSTYKTDKMRTRARKSTATSRDVQRCIADNCIEPNKKKFKIEETKSSAINTDVKECTNDEKTESGNNRIKAYVRTIATRSTDVKECTDDQRIESDNIRLKANVRTIATRSTDVKECTDDQRIESDNIRLKANVRTIATRSTDVKECTDDQRIESDNIRLKANVRTIATRSTDVKECTDDQRIESDNNRLKANVRTIATRSTDVKECTDDQRIESDNNRLKANVRTIATRSTDVKECRADDCIEPNKKRFKIEETKSAAKSQNVNECTEDKSIEQDNNKLKTNVRTITTRSTDVKEWEKEQNRQSEPIMLTTNVRKISKRISDANGYTDNQSSESDEKKLESVTREDSSKNTDAKEKKCDRRSKSDEKTFENATNNDSEVRSDGKEYEVNRIKELDEKSLKSIEREDSSGNSDVKEYKKNINSKLKEKQFAIEKVSTESTAVSSNECTDRNENTLGQSRKSNTVNLNAFGRKSTVESTDLKKCTEDQSRETDMGKLRMILIKNSETGEWTTSESLKKTVCTLRSTETAGDYEEMKMCVSKDQPDVDQNVKYVKTYGNSIDRKQKRTKIKAENDNNKNFKGKTFYADETRARNVELPERKLIAKGSVEQNIVSVSNNPNLSTELTEYSSKDVVIVEFFEDRDSLFSSEVENAKNSEVVSKDTSLTGESVDIKLIPYKKWCTNRKASVKKEPVLNVWRKDVLTKDSTVSDREDVNFSKADVVVIDCEEDRSSEDCNSDIECGVGNQAHFRKAKNGHKGTKKKPKNILPVAQNTSKHADHIIKPNDPSFQHVVDKNPHADQNHIKDGIDANEICKAGDVHIQCEIPIPNDNEKSHTNPHLNWFDVTADPVGKNNDRLEDLQNKHQFKPQAEVKEWTLCKSKVLGLNDKIHRKRSDVLDITDTVTHRDLVNTSANRIAGVLNYTRRNLNHEQRSNETFVNSPKRIEPHSMIEPGFGHTDMNNTSIEEVSESVDTNLNEFCWSQTFPASSVDNFTDNFKDVEELIGWTVDQILYSENISTEAASKPSFEHQYEDLVPEFNEKEFEHSDENKDCMIEVYVIDDDEVDENNNTTEQIVISDDVSTNIQDKSQVQNVDFGTESCLFDAEPDTGCYQTVNEHDFRPFGYESQVYAEATDSLNCGQVCNEGNASAMLDYTEQDLNLQVHGNWIETHSSTNLPPVIGINTDYIPYWDTCPFTESRTKNVNSDECKLQGMKNVRGSERCTCTENDVQQEHESGYNSQESPSGVYEESFGLNNFDADKRNQNVNFVCDAVDNKHVYVHETGVSSCIGGMNMTKSKIDADIHGVKVATTGKKVLTMSKHRNVQEGKGGDKRKRCDLCTMVEDDVIARKKLLKKLKNGQIGERPRVVRVTEHGMILDVTEEYQNYLPYLYGC